MRQILKSVNMRQILKSVNMRQILKEYGERRGGGRGDFAKARWNKSICFADMLHSLCKKARTTNLMHDRKILKSVAGCRSVCVLRRATLLPRKRALLVPLDEIYVISAVPPCCALDLEAIEHRRKNP